MAISVVKTGNHYTWTDGSSFTITGIESGDFVLIIGAADNSPVAIDAPSGFTLGDRYTDDIPDTMWAYDFATGTSLSVTSLTGDTGAGDQFAGVGYLYIVLRGVDSTSPINDSNKVNQDSNSTSINPAAVTTTVDNAWVIPIGVLDDQNTASSVSPPSGYTTIANYDVPDNGAGNFGATIMTAYLEKTSAGSEDPGSFTFSASDQARSFTVALAPTLTPTPTPTQTPTQTPTPSASGLPPITIGAGMSLDEVRTYLALAANASLQSSFTASVDEYFDIIYKGDKDRLGNFQGYEVIAPSATPTPSPTLTPTNTPTPTPTPSSIPAGITFISSGTFVAQAEGSSFTITGIQSGDLVVLSGASDSQDVGTPTGFTVGEVNNGSGTSTHSGWFYYFSTGTSVSVSGLSGTTGGFSVAYIWQVFRGVNSSNPVNVENSTHSGGGGNPNPPAVTTTANGCMILILGMLDDDTVASSVGAPSPYTLIEAVDATQYATNMSAYWLQETAGSEDPGTFTSSGDDNRSAYTIALEPA